MREKLRVMVKEDFDEEMNALAVIVAVLKPMGFDSKWRVLNYILVRMLGHRSWGLGRPKTDEP